MTRPARPPVQARSLSPERAAGAEAFIRANLPLTEVLGTGIHLHLAGSRSGLSRLVPPGGTPYWAHAWPGGVALAMYLLANPGTVRGRDAIDMGTGSGLVAIAALRAGASSVIGLDSDQFCPVATRLNAEANGLQPFPVLTRAPDALAVDLGSVRKGGGPAVVLAGDVFYDERLAVLTAAALDAAGTVLGPGTTILVGDIGRRFLPRDRLEPLASYPVRDMGDPPHAPPHEGRVFRWRGDCTKKGAPKGALWIPRRGVCVTARRALR